MRKEQCEVGRPSRKLIYIYMSMQHLKFKTSLSAIMYTKPSDESRVISLIGNLNGNVRYVKESNVFGSIVSL